MSKCNDYINNKILYPEFYSKCETCVQWSFKYKDCKLGGKNNSTAIVHGEVKHGSGGRRMVR